MTSLARCLWSHRIAKAFHLMRCAISDLVISTRSGNIPSPAEIFLKANNLSRPVSEECWLGRTESSALGVGAPPEGNFRGKYCMRASLVETKLLRWLPEQSSCHCNLHAQGFEEIVES